ncbi:MAG: Ig domain-containing protein [Prevotella ruminicola]|jgi:uncharacterized protein YjdB|uniref:Ig domain-containing protein n=1 Tax=Xylanibacter ruminicola TaxID=839 RepID=A0A928GGU4_XYLRU|nr:Ig domain-containing protein [Xylanibacter ruminicola]
MIKKLLFLLVLLLTATTGTMAQTETLLTTITPTGKDTYSETTAGVVTVTLSNVRRYNVNYGWLWSSGSVTVEAKEGYTITKCVFKQNAKTPVTITTSPFAITFADGECVQNDDMDGVTSIEVYGPVAPATTKYSVTLKEGTEDADKWTVKVGDGQFLALPTEAAEGSPITVTYSGEKKVKSVKAVKKAAATIPVTTITLNKTATSIKVGSTETLSVTAVAPDNATDKTYTWKTSDASKATVDQDGKVTAVAAGTVTIYAEANDGSGVKGSCTVTVTPATITVTWNKDDITGSGNTFTKDGVTINVGRYIDFDYKEFVGGGTFTTTLGNFTKIEVSARRFRETGTGWSGNSAKMTWTGNASSVSFSGDIIGSSDTKFVFTIEPTN